MPEQMTEQRTTPGTREPITSGVRSKIADIVKGVAIILVVYGHTAQGMIHRGWWTGPGATFSDTLIYSFHMPAFFFVAGLFVMGSLAKRGAMHFTVDKLKTILYPYLVFGLLSAALEPLIGRFKMGTAEFHWNSFTKALVDGDAGWFLFVLFFCMMLALLTSRVPAWLRFIAAVAVALLPSFGTPAVDKVLHEFCFVAAGMWVGKKIYDLDRMRTWTAAVGVVLLAAFQTAMILYYGPPALWHWTFILLGLTGTAGLFLMAKISDANWLGDGLGWIGRASLAVFLLSAFAQGATREALLTVFHTREFWIQLLLPTLFGTLLPVIVWYQQDRWRVGWLFRWPF
jgi:fucose 4-O-acetylase-like acetyltransferase